MRIFEKAYWETMATFHGLRRHMGYKATTYRLVQNIDALSKTRESFSVSEPGHASTVKAVVQGAEVALMNMTALLERSAQLLKAGNVREAAELTSVFNGFNSSMTQLSRVAGEPGGCDNLNKWRLFAL